MDNNWRSRMAEDLRQQYVDRILHSLKEQLDTPPTSRVIRGDLRTLALHIEKEIFLASTDQSDYAAKISVRMSAIETARATARVTDIGMAGATDIQKPPGGVPIQNLSDGVPLQKGVPREEELLAHVPNAKVTDVSSGGDEHLAKLLQDFPNAIVTETDGDRIIFT